VNRSASHPRAARADTRSPTARLVVAGTVGLVWSAITVGILGVLAFLVGEVVSDRFLLLQMLSWIPTEAALLSALWTLFFAVVGGAVLRRMDFGRSRSARSSPIALRTIAPIAFVVSVGLTVFLLTVEHRPWRSAPEVGEDAFTILHWNPRWPNRTRAVGVSESLAMMLEDHPADLIVLTDPGRLLFDGRAAEIADTGLTVARSGFFAVMTPHPIRELRALVRFGRVDVTLLRLAIADDAELTIWLLDLPSEIEVGRMALLREVGALLDDVGAPAPDLIVGDMNVTRRSVAVRTLAPDLRNAFGEAGRGLGSTFFEPWPLWHIDHMLITPRVEALDAVTIATGASRHRAQYGVFRLRDQIEPALPNRSGANTRSSAGESNQETLNAD